MSVLKQIELALQIADRMTLVYRAHPAEIAETCDEQIDRSGNLLGWLRDYSRINPERKEG